MLCDQDAEEAWQRRASPVRRLARTVPLVILAVAVALMLTGAGRAAPGREPEFAFDIPSQSLEAALDAYGTASRMQVLYETALTAGRRSAAVQGLFTREAALRQLLGGTGLVFSLTGEQAFTLVPAAPPAPAVLPASAVAYRSFLGWVQAGVMTALCRHAETRPGPARLAFQFCIGDAGDIRAPRLLASTGEAGRDVAVTAALAALALGRSPPSGMPQPVTMVLNADRADGDPCGASRP